MESADQLKSSIDEELLPVYQNLHGIEKKLASIKEQHIPHTFEDLRKYQQMLDAIDAKREDGIFGGSLRSGHIPKGQALCKESLDHAYDLVSSLLATASEMNTDMKWIYGSLCSLHRKLDRMVHDRSHTEEDVHHVQQQLNAIDSKRVGGIFAGSPPKIVPGGQAACAEELAACYELLEKARNSAQEMNPHMRGLHGNLKGIQKKLEALKDKPTPPTAEELRVFQNQLDAIDRDRQDGIFCGTPTTRIPPGQAVLSDMLYTCYSLLQSLQDSMESKEAP